MGATGAERLESDLTGGEMENSMKNSNIGESNGHYVKSQESNDPQTIYDVDPDPCTGQTNKIHVLTVHVGNDLVSLTCCISWGHKELDTTERLN